MRGRTAGRRDDRGQAVLLGAAVVAVALTAMLLAALQLGYHPAATSDATVDADLSRAENVLVVAVRRGATDAAGRFAWSERAAAAAVARTPVTPALKRIERLGVAADATYRTAYNDTAAPAVAERYCPSGADRVFGPCAAHGPVVLQERAGEAHVLAVVVDVRMVGPDRTARATLVVRPFEREGAAT